VLAQVAVKGLTDFKMPKETHVKSASTIEQWANLARQQVKLFVALYGTEHSVERLNFIRYLEMLNNTQSARYPLKMGTRGMGQSMGRVRCGISVVA